MTGELQLLAALVAGLAGSTHCLGMCGAIVVLFEKNQTKKPLRRRASYQAGRLSFYTLLGAIAGAGGAILTKTAGIDTGLVVLRLIAAALVVAIGLNLVFQWNAINGLERIGAGLWQRVSPLLRHVLPASSLGQAVAAGFLWGALPCGLVYSAVALAATTGNPATAAATMAVFWLGTLPALLLAGTSADRLSRIQAKPAVRILTGCVLIVIGGLAFMPVKMLVT